jgi:hypothetical protein
MEKQRDKAARRAQRKAARLDSPEGTDLEAAQSDVDVDVEDSATPDAATPDIAQADDSKLS